MTLRKIIFLTLIFIFSACEKERELGVLSIDGIENVSFKLYQENKLDKATAVLYEIIDTKNSILVKKSFLIGTGNHLTDLTEFTARSADSIIYLTFLNENTVYAIFDLKSGKGYPKGIKNEMSQVETEYGNKLLSKIKLTQPDLIASWEK